MSPNTVSGCLVRKALGWFLVLAASESWYWKALNRPLINQMAMPAGGSSSISELSHQWHSISPWFLVLQKTYKNAWMSSISGLVGISVVVAFSSKWPSVLNGVVAISKPYPILIWWKPIDRNVQNVFPQTLFFSASEPCHHFEPRDFWDIDLREWNYLSMIERDDKRWQAQEAMVGDAVTGKEAKTKGRDGLARESIFCNMAKRFV